MHSVLKSFVEDFSNNTVNSFSVFGVSDFMKMDPGIIDYAGTKIFF